MRIQQQNAAIYCRLSRDDGGDAESNSISNQRDMLRQYAKDNGIVVKSEYVDDGISGTTFERVGFQRMIEDIENKIVNVVLCKDLSRLGRNNAMVAYYTEIHFVENNVRFIAVNDGIDSALGDNEIMGFKSVINEFYARDISKKIRSTFKTKAIKGQFVGSQAPYGYRKDPDDYHHLLIDPETEPNVKRIFAMAAEGISPANISRIMSRDKILTPRAYTAKRTGKYLHSHNEEFPTDWNKSSVQMILRNREYLGHVVSNKSTTKSFKSKKHLMRSEDDWIEVRDMHEPIIDELTFDKVQRYVAVKHRANTATFENVFQGLLRCSTCGSNLAFQNQQGRHKDANFCCNKYRRYTTHCTMHYIRYSILYKLVLQHIQRVAAAAKAHEGDLETFLLTIRDEKRDSGTERSRWELDTTTRRIRELDGIIKKLLEQNAAGAISDERFATLATEYDTEQSGLTTKADELRERLIKQKSDTHGAAQFLRLVTRYTDIQELTAPILAELIDHIVIYDGQGRYENRTQQVDIHYRFVGLLPDNI
ncbi:recombinase [Clostridia bacterium]|nr:recombinase [Clostridia bacterium]